MSSGLPDEVSVLILGGTLHLSRPLLKWLINPKYDADRANITIKHIRLADKYLVSDGVSSTYTDPDTWAALKDPSGVSTSESQQCRYAVQDLRPPRWRLV